jgi:hypothetical protein
MYASAPAEEMTPEQRRREVFHILARGLLRLRKRHISPEFPVETDENSAAGGLDVRAKTVLSGRNG